MGASPQLAYSTGNPAIDRWLGAALALLETTYPGMFRSYYLFGSYADGSAVTSSDIDLFLVSHDRLDAEIPRQVLLDLRVLTRSVPADVDLLIVDAQTLLREGQFRVKHASRFIYGEDLRDHMPEQSTEQWLRRYSEAPLAYSLTVLRRAEWLNYPLAYPDPDGEFFGYDQACLPPSDVPVVNIKALVAGALWIATILVAVETGQRASTKAQSVSLYRSAIGDEWSKFLHALYHHGKERWSYRVPDDPGDRLLLRSLCEQMLAFENQYFARHRDWLQEQLRSEDVESRRFARSQLSRIRFSDPPPSLYS